MNKKYTLYHSNYCGYCHWLRSEAAKLGVEFDLVDVDTVPGARQRLLEGRGRGTVPVLEKENGELMGESRDILAFLKAELESLSEETAA